MPDQKNDKVLYLLDAYALIYRAFYALGDKFLYNSKGMNTTAISVFTDSLLKLIQKENPSHIAIAFDLPDQVDRAVEYEGYKANREEMPEDLQASIPWIRKIIEAMHIPIIEAPGYEADDIIGTIAKQQEKNGYKVYMVTPDKDYGQLVSENILMYKPPYRGKPEEILGVQEVLDKFEIDTIPQVIDYLGLMGDAVDNIPGIPGVGPKTASKFLKEYGSMEALLENTDKLKGKMKEKVEENKEQALMSKRLATIICDVPLEYDVEQFVMEDPDKDTLSEIFAELEFRTLGKRIVGDEFDVNQAPTNGQGDLFRQSVDQSAAEGVSGGNNIENTKHEYTLCDTADKRAALVKDLLKQKAFAWDTETTGLDPLTAELVGMSFSWEAGKGYYVPLSDKREEVLKVLEEFKPVFSNKVIEKVGHNSKYDIKVLLQYNVEVEGPHFDTMLAHYLLEPDSRRRKLDYLSETHLGYSMVPIEDLIGKGKKQLSMRDVAVEKAGEYAAEDADITWQLREKFAPRLKEDEVQELFSKLEIPLMPILAKMECEGVKLDVQFLEDYSKELEKDILSTREEVFKTSGLEFNLDSPKQLGEVLFDKMGIEYKGKKTKTGQYSTAEDVMLSIANKHPIAQKVLDYRELTKLKSTYVDALPKLVNSDTGRVHTHFQQTVAATGRLSSKDPNLQNIPIKTEKGRKVREAFIPRSEDFLILSADYSQIELRIIAALSKEENMLQAFANQEDIHTATAAKVFGVAASEVDRGMRTKAKAVNFGIAYGQSAFGLSQSLGISRSEAKEIIDNYFEQFPGIQRYMDETQEFARQHGYVETILKRRRYLPDINSRNRTVRAAAERNAINAPIQGSAADMIKKAMVDLNAELIKKQWQSKMTLQVHDELVFDAHKDEIEDIKPIIIDKMQNAIKLDVPILVEVGVGDNWLQAH